MPKLGFMLIFVGIALLMFILLRGVRALVKLGGDERKKQLGTLIFACITVFVLVIELIAQVVTTGVILHWW
jgi:hypothetical protein